MPRMMRTRLVPNNEGEEAVEDMWFNPASVAFIATNPTMRARQRVMIETLSGARTDVVGTMASLEEEWLDASFGHPVEDDGEPG